MGETHAQVSATEGSEQGERLDSWKEIAAYLRREVKTVQRWERELNLPVHRLFHTQRARVFAYTAELDAWAAQRSGIPSPSEEIAGTVDSPTETRSDLPFGGRRSWLLAAFAASMLAVILYLGLNRDADLADPTAPELIAAPFTSTLGLEDHPRISPDGKQITFKGSTAPDGNEDIYVQLVGSQSALRLTNSAEREYSPTWSPDGTEILFLRRLEQGVRAIQIPALGGPETVLADLALGANGISYSPAGNEVLAIVDSESAGGSADSIFLLSLRDGTKRRLSHGGRGSVDCCPRFDPSGERVAYIRLSGSRGEVHVVSVEGDEVQVLPVDAQEIAWTAEGDAIVFSAPSAAGGGALYRVSLGDGRIENVGIGGTNTTSPDIRGGRLAYTRWILTSNIWSLELQPGETPNSAAASRLIYSTRRQYAPDFSPDGEWIVFASDRTGFQEIWISDKTGGNLRVLTEFRGSSAGSPRWSPDGKSIAFDSNDKGSVDIYVVPATGGVPRRLTDESSSDAVPAWSHDGKWIYFVSDRSGERQIWKIPAEGGDALQVTHGGAFECRASSDGQYLYYAVDKREEMGRLRLSDGTEEVIPEISGIGRLRRYWTLSEDGIYFIRQRELSTESSFVEFFRFSNSEISTVAEIDRPVFDSSAGLAVSPDGRTLLYVLKEQDERDIMLVENFR